MSQFDLVYIYKCERKVSERNYGCQFFTDLQSILISENIF